MSAEDDDNDQSNDYEDEDEAEDDEATLDEEDSLLNDEEADYDTELKELQEDGELSLEQLRQKYYGGSAEESQQKASCIPSENGMNNTNMEKTDIRKKGPQTSSTSSRKIGSLRGRIFAASTCDDSITPYFNPEDLEEDESEDYVPPELWKKDIRMGPEYQATNIPGFSSASASCQEKAEVLWEPSPIHCTDQLVAEYLVDCEQIRAGDEPKNLKRGKADVTLLSDVNVPDDENALFALYKANYDTKVAKANAPFEWAALCSANGPRLTQPPGPWKTWSEKDCSNFEEGLLKWGKCFWKIRRDLLPNRMLGELVCFYYSWKKSQRHDAWRAEKGRRDQQLQLDKKNADLMERIADPLLQENGPSAEGNKKVCGGDSAVSDGTEANAAKDKVSSSSSATGK